MGTAYQSFQARQKVSRCKPELLATKWIPCQKKMKKKWYKDDAFKKNSNCKNILNTVNTSLVGGDELIDRLVKIIELTEHIYRKTILIIM